MTGPVTGCELQRLREEVDALSAAQAAQFDAGVPVPDLLLQRAAAFDGWLCRLWQQLVDVESEDTGQSVNPAKPDTERGRSPALFATGGYGRGELYPESDVDVMILVDTDAPAAQMRRIEGFVSALWDLNLRPGHAVRSLAQCHAEAANDITVCTALMEARLLAGPAAAAAALQAQMAPAQVWPVAQFVDAKLAEAAARHSRYGDTSYNLEPNLKEGPGGLRDIQTLAWVAQRITGSREPQAWTEAGLIGPRGLQQLARSQAALQKLRFGLHLAADRAEERLLFDYQPGLAQRFGLRDEHHQNRAVEQMMQDYFRAALGVRRVYARVTERLQERSAPAQPAQPLAGGFQRQGRRLALADGRSLAGDPAAIIGLFVCWQNHPDLVALTTATSAALEKALAELDRPLADDIDARSAFLALMRGPRVAETLTRMHLYGVLGSYLPAFAQVTGRMQYDLFHAYTVDQHTLHVIANLDRFAADQAEEFPRAASVFDNLRKPELLYLAALFHDIAKGRGGDHSELGAVDARIFCQAHGLGGTDTELVAWLVRQHLMLSTVAQKSDITDPAVINRFAANVGDRERLDMLYLLTMADIAGTAPTLWNAWKARLTADLHTSARFAIRRGLQHPIEADERILECRQQALELLANEGIDAATAATVWDDFPPPSFLRYRPGQIAWVTAQVVNASHQVLPVIAVRAEGERGAREIFIHSPDLDGLFAAITSALDRLDLDVVEARVLTSRKGMSLDTFRVLERNRRGPDPQRDPEIAALLRQALLRQPLRFGPVQRNPSRTQRHFHMTPQIEFSDQEPSGRTRMALVCSDRPGLLAQVAQVLRALAIRVHGARIATFGERAEDFFVLSDEANQPLSAERCQTLAAHLHERLAD
ncbi:MAG: [protein-PII] uridylyltransferase [Xanthomonadales bacterium]|nr:[protein-PII] uridylyltransferase [Xanthomonadales bacterium]